jgi:hypothetical protein
MVMSPGKVSGFTLLHRIQISHRVSLLLIRCVLGALSLAIKWQDIDHSCLSSAVIKKGEPITPFIYPNVGITLENCF